MISIVGDDGTNIEIAVLAHQLNQKRTSGALECVVHVFDPRLQRALKKHRIFTDTADPFDLRLFNAFEIGAQAMLRRQPALDGEAPGDAGRPHLLIVGLGRLGESLLVQAAAEWRDRRKTPADRLCVTVIDRHAKLREDWLRAVLSGPGRDLPDHVCGNGHPFSAFPRAGPVGGKRRHAAGHRRVYLRR